MRLLVDFLLLSHFLQFSNGADICEMVLIVNSGRDTVFFIYINIESYNIMLHSAIL